MGYASLKREVRL